MAKTKSKTETKSGEDKKKNKLSAPSSANDKKSRANGLGKRLSQMGPDENELENDEWRCVVVMVVEGSSDYLRYTRLLQEALLAGRRRCVVCITRDQIITTIKQTRVREIPKRVTEARQGQSSKSSVATPKISTRSVMDGGARTMASLGVGAGAEVEMEPLTPWEEASQLLRGVGDVPPTLMAQLLRLELLRFRIDELRRRHSEAQAKLKLDSSSDFFYSDKPILNTLVDGEKERTRLRKRGCLVSKLDAIEDQPEDGPDIYVVLVGFHCAQLPGELLRAGVPLRSLVIVIEEDDQDDAIESAAMRVGDVRTTCRSWLYVNQGQRVAQERAEREAAEAAAQAAHVSVKSGDWATKTVIPVAPTNVVVSQAAIEVQNFWPEFEQMLWNPVYYDSLKDVTLMSLVIPRMIVNMSDEMIKPYLYDEMATVVYDIATTELLKKAYCERMLTSSLSLPTHLPRIADSQRGASLYHSAMRALPSESDDVPLRLRAMLQQVEYWLSQTVRESEITSRSPSFADVSLVDVVKSELEMFLDKIIQQYGQSALSGGKVKFADPLVVVEGDTVLMRAFHVCFPVTGAVEVLGNMAEARLWDELPRPASKTPGDPLRHFVALLTDRLRASHGVHASSATLLLEMVAFLGLRCGKAPPPPPPRPHTPVLSSDVTSRSSGTSGSTPAAATPSSAATSASSASSAEARPAPAPASAPGPAPAGTAGKAGGVRERWSGGGGSAAEQANGDDGEHWDDVWSLVDEDSGEYSECRQSWQKAPTIDELHTPNDVLRFVEATMESPDYLAGIDLGTQHQEGQAPAAQAQQPQSAGQTQPSSDNVSLSNASASQVQRRLSGQNALETPDPPGAPFALEAHRYARELSPNILLQQLFQAQVEKQCFDCQYFRPTDVLLIRAHDPVDHDGLWHWRVNVSLPSSEVGLRDFHDCVMDEAQRWLAAEEEREERRRHTRALREAMSRRKMTKFPPGRGSGKRLVSAASTESASGARAAASGAAAAAAAVDDALVDPAEFSLFALDDFLRPKSIKMALFVGNTSVRRERDRRTFAMSRAEVGEHSETPGATDPGTSTQALHKTSSKSDKSAKHSSKHKLPKDADDADATKSKEKTQGDERKKAGKSSSRGSQGQDTAQDVSEVPLAYEADEEGGSRLPRDPTLPGFELGARRWQLLSDTRRFACADGCAVSVDVDDWLHRAKNVAIKMTQGGHTLTLHHEVRAESQQRARFFNFHLTLSNGVVMAFGRTRDSPPFTRLHSPPPGAPPTSPATNTSSTTWTPSATSSDTSTACEDAAFKARVDDTFAFRLRMSWPSGLLVETVKKPNRPVYIRQRYVSKGPECTDIMEELRRCYLHDGTVLKFMRKQNRTCSMTPNGAVVISTAYDPPLFGAGMSPVPESADPTPSAAPSRSDTMSGAAGGKKRGKEQPGGRRRSRMSSPPAAGASPATTPSQAASAAHSVTIAPSTRRFAPRRSEEESAFAPGFRRRVVSLETVQPDGQRWEVQMGAGDAPATWTPTGIYIVRTHTDYEVNETLKRRGDGTVALFKPNGDLVVSFPDGTQITSGPPPAPQPSRRVRKKSSEGASMVGSLSALTAGGSSVLRSIVSSRASPATSTPSAIASAAVSTRTTPGPPTPVASETRPARPATVPTPVAAAPHTAHFSDANEPLQSRSWTAQQQPVPRIIPAMQIYTALTPASTYPTLQDTPSAPRSRGRGSGAGSAGGVAKRVSVASPPEGLSAIEEEGASPSAHPLLPPEHLRLLADAERAARNAVLGRSGSSVTCFDHFEVLHSAYRIEHRNYATVEFDDTTGIVELKIPDATVQVFPDGTYHVQMPGDMHDLGDTTVTLEVGAEEIHMKHHLKESGELLCRNDIDIAFLGVPPPLAMDQVLCSTVDGVGRSFDVQYSGQSSYRRRGPGEHVVFSENTRYFLVHRDLTGLELHTADALRRLIARTEEDRRSIYMSQVVVKRPDLSYHVSLRPLLSESERWLLPLPPLRLSSYEFRKRARAVAAAAAAATSSSKAVVATGRQAGDGAGEGVGAEQPLRSTYGVPPSWFHPFPKSAREQLMGQLERSGSHQQDSGSSGDDDEDLTAHPGMEVPDPLLVDMLKEMVPRRMRLRRAVRSAVEAIAVAVCDSEEILRERSAQRLEMREEARCDLSHVEHRRLSKRQARLSMVRPCWQEKTSSPAALNLYRLATHRRTSISMSISEENLFQQFSVLTGAKRGHAAAKRDREAQQVQELRALLRLGRGPPYFETPAGRRFLEEDAAAHKAAAKAAARSKTLVEEASARVASAQHLLDQEVGTVTPIALAPQIPTTPPTPTTPPPPPPCTTDKASFDSSHSSSSSSTACKRCGSVCEHTKRECRGETTLLGAHSELSTYFPSDERQ